MVVSHSEPRLFSLSQCNAQYFGKLLGYPNHVLCDFGPHQTKCVYMFVLSIAARQWLMHVFGEPVAKLGESATLFSSILMRGGKGCQSLRYSRYQMDSTSPQSVKQKKDCWCVSPRIVLTRSVRCVRRHRQPSTALIAGNHWTCLALDAASDYCSLRASFFCRMPSCPRQIFTERIPELLDPSSRFTRQLYAVTDTTGGDESAGKRQEGS